MHDELQAVANGARVVRAQREREAVERRSMGTDPFA
jgi:hypothetical protein